MAKNCCICERKLNPLISPIPLIDSNKELLICTTCRFQRNALTSSTIIDDIKESIEYFQTYLSNNISSEASDFLEKNIINAQKRIETKTKKELEKVLQEEENKRISKINMDSLLNNNLITTGYAFENYKITKYCGIVSGEVVLGTGFLSEFSASVSDLFGTKSNTFASKMIEAKNVAQQQLINNALNAGGNAIIGVNFDYITFGNNMVGVSVNGTAVVVKEIIE